MKNVIDEPDFKNDGEATKFRRKLNRWRANIRKLDDEMLLMIREEINYQLDTRHE